MPKILIVDDDDHFKLNMERKLKRHGYDVLSTSDACEAIKLIKANDFDVVIADLVMEHDKAGLDILEAAKDKDESTKDRIDKIFIDKFLYNRLTGAETPHFAIFLNDIQRKGKEGKYGINATFLSGHFKGYTVKLNPLDCVYYCDIRPNMLTEDILKDHIRTFDHLLFSDIWEFTK